MGARPTSEANRRNEFSPISLRLWVPQVAAQHVFEALSLFAISPYLHISRLRHAFLVNDEWLRSHQVQQELVHSFRSYWCDAIHDKQSGLISVDNLPSLRDWAFLHISCSVTMRQLWSVPLVSSKYVSGICLQNMQYTMLRYDGRNIVDILQKEVKGPEYHNWQYSIGQHVQLKLYI